MGFANGYMEGSPLTFKVSLEDKQGFSQKRWRMSKDIEGAMWDYLGDKKKGLGGELGTLHFDLSLNQYSGDSLEAYILQAYGSYLNGPEGTNSEIRKTEMGEGLPMRGWVIGSRTHRQL
ncbi:hypothetical protein ACFL2V_02220 [Pseudomonadota bacterium]